MRRIDAARVTILFAALLVLAGCAARNEPCPMAASVEQGEAAADKAVADANKAADAARLATAAKDRTTAAADKVENEHVSMGPR